MTDKLREAFERDVCKRYELKTAFVDGVGYTNVATVVAWEGFQAGHAHAMRDSAAIAQQDELLQQALESAGCERLRDFAAVGPAQMSAVELFAERLLAAILEKYKPKE